MLKLIPKRQAPPPPRVEELAPTAEVAEIVPLDHRREIDVGDLPSPIQCLWCRQWYLKPMCNVAEQHLTCANWKFLERKKAKRGQAAG
jgi:hypothetical protein